jgi:AcrR family transcriptional regulator
MSATVIRLALMSVTVITYAVIMVRWEPDARGRLGKAAFELFLERGFEQVTVAEIAERAGLTERTFFRYFADKREVLFAGSQAFQDLFVASVENAPESAVPIDAIGAALYTQAGQFMEHEAAVRRRQAIIAAHPELRERELIKLATVAAAVADTLRRRGVGEPSASLTAEAGMAVFKIAFERWIADPAGPDLDQVIRESLAELKVVAIGGGVADGSAVATGTTAVTGQ